MPRQLFIGNFVHCRHLGDLQILLKHLVVVNEHGFITYSEPAESETSTTLILLQSLIDVSQIEHIDQYHFMIPTFCDLHLHAPQFLYQGTGLHLPLMEWLDEYAFKAEESIDANPALAEAVYDRLAERLLECGTGAAVLFGTIREDVNMILAKTMLSKGLRAYIGKLSMDLSTRPTYKEESTEESLQSAVSFADKCYALTSNLHASQRVVEPILTPRFVPTCSDELLQGLGKLAKDRGLRVQSHLAEAHDQLRWVRHERGAEDIDVFQRSGLLTSRTIQAHCTFLSPPSLQRLTATGTAVAHCPLSNAYFSAEPFRLREALDLSVKVGLGTDIAGGFSLDIMQAMRQAVMVSRMREGQRIMRVQNQEDDNRGLSVDWIETLYLATTGGAKAMGLASGTGTFSVNAPFDAQCEHVSGKGVGSLDFFLDDEFKSKARQLTEATVEKWWCLGDMRNREAMWVQGRKVWRANYDKGQTQPVI